MLLNERDIVAGDECPDCQGQGKKHYANTSTWRYGIGGAAVTMDVCDKCWGSGSRTRT
jgi:DnaJ-class molecular chaperone